MQFSSGRHGCFAHAAPASAQRPSAVSRYWLPLRRDLRLSRPYGRRVVFEFAQSSSSHDGGAARECTGHSLPKRSHALLPVKKSGAAHGRPGRFRHLVYGTATRAVAHTQEPEEAGTTPVAFGKIAAQSQRARGLDLV